MSEVDAAALTDKITERLNKEILQVQEYPMQVHMMIQALILLGTPSKIAQDSVLAVYRRGALDTINIFADELGKVAKSD